MNTAKAAEKVFGGRRLAKPMTYLGAPIQADFELTYENLAPYVNQVLDLAAPIEGTGRFVTLIEIKNGIVRVEGE